MRLIIYEAQDATKQQFIEYWSALYNYNLETLYCDNINRELTEERTLALFKWKNGGPLSARKRTSILQNFLHRRDELDDIDLNQPAQILLDQFPNGGAIWRISWLHCLQTSRFPIYDQHVFRAMAYIQYGIRKNIPPRDSDKIISYCSRYLPFYEGFSDMNQRNVDRALWQFGKFLSQTNTTKTAA